MNKIINLVDNITLNNYEMLYGPPSGTEDNMLKDVLCFLPWMLLFVGLGATIIALVQKITKAYKTGKKEQRENSLENKND